jgi:hypothetical protein
VSSGSRCACGRTVDDFGLRTNKGDASGLDFGGKLGVFGLWSRKQAIRMLCGLLNTPRIRSPQGVLERSYAKLHCPRTRVNLRAHQ